MLYVKYQKSNVKNPVKLKLKRWNCRHVFLLPSYTSSGCPAIAFLIAVSKDSSLLHWQGPGSLLCQWHLFPPICSWCSTSWAHLWSVVASSTTDTPSQLNLSPTTVRVMVGSGSTPSGLGVEWSLYQSDTWLVTTLKNCLYALCVKGKLS